MSSKCCLEGRWGYFHTHSEIFFWNVGTFREEIYFLCLLLQVNWHDFAFFDPVMYESLRQLIRHSQAGEADAVFAAMDLAFAIDLCKEEGAGQVKDHTDAAVLRNAANP